MHIEICPYCSKEIKVSYGICICPICRKRINVYPNDTIILKRLMNIGIKEVIRKLFKL